MNNWDFNELTQQDQLDFKACQRQDGSVYGVPDKSDCQKGKEIKTEDLQKLATAANKGDEKAKQQLRDIEKVNKEQKDKAKAEKKKAEQEKKAKAAEGKGKKGKGGKGKKGGGKGKGGKGGAGGGKAAAAKTESREAKVKRFRGTIDQLQQLMKRVTDPKQRERLQQRINDVLKSVLDMAPKGTEGAQVAEQAKQSLEKKDS